MNLGAAAVIDVGDAHFCGAVLIGQRKLRADLGQRFAAFRPPVESRDANRQLADDIVGDFAGVEKPLMNAVIERDVIHQPYRSCDFARNIKQEDTRQEIVVIRGHEIVGNRIDSDALDRRDVVTDADAGLIIIDVWLAHVIDLKQRFSDVAVVDEVVVGAGITLIPQFHQPQIKGVVLRHGRESHGQQQMLLYDSFQSSRFTRNWYMPMIDQLPGQIEVVLDRLSWRYTRLAKPEKPKILLTRDLFDLRKRMIAQGALRADKLE